MLGNLDENGTFVSRHKGRVITISMRCSYDAPMFDGLAEVRCESCDKTTNVDSLGKDALA